MLSKGSSWRIKPRPTPHFTWEQFMHALCTAAHSQVPAEGRFNRTRKLTSLNKLQPDSRNGIFVYPPPPPRADGQPVSVAASVPIAGFERHTEPRFHHHRLKTCNPFAGPLSFVQVTEVVHATARSAMATITQMATGTAFDVPQASLSRYRGKTTEQKTNSTTKRIRDTKYRHVFATHSATRTSCLSHDAESSPSFVGFRNLMILVLSTHPRRRLCPRKANECSCIQFAIDDCKLAKGTSLDFGCI